MSIYVFILLATAVWATALVCVCRRRDIDVHDKITWVVVILALHGLGGMLYLALSPAGQKQKTDGVPDTTPDQAS